MQETGAGFVDLRGVLVRVRISILHSPVLLAAARAMGAARPESVVASCPNCGRTDIRRLKHRDRIDRMQQVPWSVVQKWLGGKLYGCKFCRVQFFDCRAVRAKAASAGVGA